MTELQKPKAPKGVPVTLLRGYTIEEGKKIAAGTEIKLPMAEAKRLVDLEVAIRADKMTEE